MEARARTAGTRSYPDGTGTAEGGASTSWTVRVVLNRPDWVVARSHTHTHTDTDTYYIIQYIYINIMARPVSKSEPILIPGKRQALVSAAEPSTRFDDGGEILLGGVLEPRLERAATVGDPLEDQERGTVTMKWQQQNSAEPQLGRSVEGFDSNELECLFFEEQNLDRRRRGGSAAGSSSAACSGGTPSTVDDNSVASASLSSGSGRHPSSSGKKKRKKKKRKNKIDSSIPMRDFREKADTRDWSRAEKHSSSRKKEKMRTIRRERQRKAKSFMQSEGSLLGYQERKPDGTLSTPRKSRGRNAKRTEAEDAVQAAAIHSGEQQPDLGQLNENAPSLTTGASGPVSIKNLDSEDSDGSETASKIVSNTDLRNDSAVADRILEAKTYNYAVLILDNKDLNKVPKKLIRKYGLRFLERRKQRMKQRRVKGHKSNHSSLPDEDKTENALNNSEEACQSSSGQGSIVDSSVSELRSGSCASEYASSYNDTPPSSPRAGANSVVYPASGVSFSPSGSPTRSPNNVIKRGRSGDGSSQPSSNTLSLASRFNSFSLDGGTINNMSRPKQRSLLVGSLSQQTRPHSIYAQRQYHETDSHYRWPRCVEEVRLYKNRLKRLPRWFISAFPRLQHIALSSNKFRKFPLEALSKENLPKLGYLDMSHNEIAKLPEDLGLCLAPTLSYLNFGHNNLKNLPTSLCALPK